MTEEGRAPIQALGAVLYTISLIYSIVLKLRAFAYHKRILPSRHLPCKVICVGNITVGGTGKTPMTMHVADEIRQLGYKVVIVSRGYRGRAEGQGGIVSDGNSIYLAPDQAGDEPYMIACCLREIPVIVGKNRYAAGMLAVNEFQPDVIVLDDGFQHLSLKRDIDLVLLDHAHPFGNTHLLPRGTLREPISSLARGTACILTRHQMGRENAATNSMKSIKKFAPQRPIFTSYYDFYCYAVKSGQPISVNGLVDRCSPQEIERIKKKSCFGFSGIAHNADFQKTIEELGFKSKGFLKFSDHHRYTVNDLNFIQSKAENAGARRLITTEKDLVRLYPENPFALELIVVGVKVSFGDDQQGFASFLAGQLSL